MTEEKRQDSRQDAEGSQQEPPSTGIRFEAESVELTELRGAT